MTFGTLTPGSPASGTSPRALNRSLVLSALVLLAFAALVAACDGVGNDFDGKITDISIGFGGGAATIVGEPVTVEAFVTDNFGIAVAGATVRWSVGEGSLNVEASETGSSGQAVTEWTLGTTAAPQTITARVEGAEGVDTTVSVSASIGPVGAIEASLDRDSVQVGRTTTLRVTRIADVFGNEVPEGEFNRYGVEFFSLDPQIARVVPPPGSETGVRTGIEGVSEGDVLLAVTAAAAPPGRSEFRLADGAAADTLSLSVLSFVSAGPFAASQVSAGAFFSCGLDTEQRVYCWGENVAGQLGVGDFEPRLLPASVDLPGPALSVSAGGSHACALLGDGQVYCWGEALRGRLGNGVDGDELFPTPVRALLPAEAGAAVEVEAGDASTCARMDDGDIYCWGLDTAGVIGDGAPPEATEVGAPDIRVNTPVRVDAPPGVRFAALGSSIADHTCAVAEDGAAYCWGKQAPEFRLGNGFSTDQLSPVPVRVQPDGVVFQSASALAIASVGLGTDGQLYGWGFADAEFPTGNGLMQQVFQATPVMPSEPFTALAGGGGTHACALSSTGAASCWGDNPFGQLGTGSTDGSFTPVPVATGLSFESIEVSFPHSCAVIEGGGEAYCWGSNQFGELGTGNTRTAVPIPTRVETESDDALRPLPRTNLAERRRAWCAAISDGLRRSTGLCGPTF
ncbi:MAG: hypothetical protein AAGI91_15585 [Bacteroidota bacterium]